MNLIRLTLILLTISKPLINYCDKCCQCCCCKKQNNVNKEYKKDTKSNTTPPNENNDEDYSKINLDYIENPTLPPNYFTNQETIDTFIESISDKNSQEYIKSRTKEDQIVLYKLLLEYAKNNKLDPKNFQIFKTNGQHAVQITNGDKTIYVKQDNWYHNFYIDLLKHLNLTDLKYKYTLNYLLTEEIKNMTPISPKTYDDWKTFKNNIGEITNLVPFFIVICFLEITDVNLFNHNNLYLTKENGKTLMKTLDVDINEKLSQNFTKVIYENTRKYFDSEDQLDILKSDKFDDDTKKFLIKLSSFGISKEDNTIYDKFPFDDDTEEIKLDKNYIQKIKKALGKSQKIIQDYVDTYSKELNINIPNYIYKLEKIYHEKEYNYNTFFDDFIKRTWDKIKDKKDDNNNKLFNDVNEYKKWLKDFITKAEPIYNSVKKTIEIYVFRNEEIPGNRIKNITEAEKNDTIIIFKKMLDWLIANKNNPKYSKMCYNKVVAKIKYVQKNGLYKSEGNLNFLFENNEIRSKINKL